MKLPLPRNFKPNKTWIILGVALGIGLVAALVASSYLSSQMAAIEQRAKGQTVPVVVAKRDLAKGEKLSADNLAVRPVPQDYAHSAAIAPEQFERIDGETLAYPLKSGEMVLWGLLETKKAPTFSARVASGHRAITVAVDEINSISGMLEPGDIIDLIVTLDQKGQKVTFPLLQGAQVMATGQRSEDDPKSGERRQYSTVTLDTTPEQARQLIVARETGKVTALLRNPQDRQAMTQVDTAALLGLKGDINNATGTARQIPVLYGGSASKFTPEDLKLDQYASIAAAAGANAAAGMAGAPAVVTADSAGRIGAVGNK